MDDGSKYLTENFFSESQIQRIAIYFSRNCRTGLNDPLTELISRMLEKPLSLSFTMHGLFLYNLQFLYPYTEFDEKQRNCTEKLLRKFTHHEFGKWESLSDGHSKSEDEIPDLKHRISNQMGGGGIIQIHLNLKLDETTVMIALVRGILTGKDHNHSLKYRKHALSVQLQRIMVRVDLHRVLTMKINEAIDFICASELVKENN